MMRKFESYWRSDPEWWDITDDDEAEYYLTEKAPPEARESFERYLEEKKEYHEILYGHGYNVE